MQGKAVNLQVVFEQVKQEGLYKQIKTLKNSLLATGVVIVDRPSKWSREEDYIHMGRFIPDFSSARCSRVENGRRCDISSRGRQFCSLHEYTIGVDKRITTLMLCFKQYREGELMFMIGGNPPDAATLSQDGAFESTARRLMANLLFEVSDEDHSRMAI